MVLRLCSVVLTRTYVVGRPSGATPSRGFSAGLARNRVSTASMVLMRPWHWCQSCRWAPSSTVSPPAKAPLSRRTGYRWGEERERRSATSTSTGSTERRRQEWGAGLGCHRRKVSAARCRMGFRAFGGEPAPAQTGSRAWSAQRSLGYMTWRYRAVRSLPVRGSDHGGWGAVRDRHVPVH